jgi:hypothetical protein
MTREEKDDAIWKYNSVYRFCLYAFVIAMTACYFVAIYYADNSPHMLALNILLTIMVLCVSGLLWVFGKVIEMGVGTMELMLEHIKELGGVEE